MTTHLVAGFCVSGLDSHALQVCVSFGRCWNQFASPRPWTLAASFGHPTGGRPRVQGGSLAQIVGLSVHPGPSRARPPGLRTATLAMGRNRQGYGRAWFMALRLRSIPVQLRICARWGRGPRSSDRGERSPPPVLSAIGRGERSWYPLTLRMGHGAWCPTSADPCSSHEVSNVAADFASARCRFFWGCYSR